MNQGQSISQLQAHTLVWIRSGIGTYEVDFKPYVFSEEILLYLEPGQYFRITSGELQVETAALKHGKTKTEDYRYLFKHLLTVGHTQMSLSESEADELFLKQSLNKWLQLNPFRASRDELELLFDIHRQVEKSVRSDLNVKEVIAELPIAYHKANDVVRQKLNITIHNLIHYRKLLEAQRELTFSNRSVKEVAYGLGFRDPAYFSRFFNKAKNVSPELFREGMGIHANDHTIEDFFHLVEIHFREAHHVSFYADQLHMSTRTLSRRIGDQTSQTPKEIINKRLTREASKLLKQSTSIKEIAWHLGFQESQHFTNHFKLHTGITPSEYIP